MTKTNFSLPQILIVKTSSLGDILQTFPVVEHLKKIYPQAEIDWVVEKPFASLVENYPLISKAIVIDSKGWVKWLYNKQAWSFLNSSLKTLREKKYDLLFDLQSNTKSALVTLCCRAERKIGFAKDCVHEWPNLLATNERYSVPKNQNRRVDYLSIAEQATRLTADISSSGTTLKVSPEEMKLVDKLFYKAPINKPFRVLRAFFEKTPPPEYKVVVCPGSMWPNKQLDTKVLIKFLSLLNEKLPCHYFLVFGSEKEKAIVEEVHQNIVASTVVEKLSLPALQSLMSRSDLVLSCDSLPLHLAGTTKTPTFSFFGPSLASKYRPLGSQHGSIQGNCPYGKTFDSRCPILRTCKTGACLKELSAEKILEAFMSWQKARQAERSLASKKKG